MTFIRRFVILLFLSRKLQMIVIVLTTSVVVVIVIVTWYLLTQKEFLKYVKRDGEDDAILSNSVNEINQYNFVIFQIQPYGTEDLKCRLDLVKTKKKWDIDSKEDDSTKF